MEASATAFAMGTSRGGAHRMMMAAVSGVIAAAPIPCTERRAINHQNPVRNGVSAVIPNSAQPMPYTARIFHRARMIEAGMVPAVNTSVMLVTTKPP